jgi:hypothetical protein
MRPIRLSSPTQSDDIPHDRDATNHQVQHVQRKLHELGRSNMEATRQNVESPAQCEHNDHGQYEGKALLLVLVIRPQSKPIFV